MQKILPICLFAFMIIILTIACSDTSIADKEPLTFDLEAYDYFESEIPFNGVNSNVNFTDDRIAALGRLLFYDNKLSFNNSVSCASCHKQHMAFSDNTKFSSGLNNELTSRNSMTLVNNVFQRFNFWEGHRGSLESNILAPVSNHLEMGMKSPEELVGKLSQVDMYVDLFEEVFNDNVTKLNIRTALTAFVGSLVSYNSKFDEGKKKDFLNFSVSELKGMELFNGKAMCANCHKGDQFIASWRNTANIGLDLEYRDQGSSDGKFKVPTLRNVELTAPYMHDGRFETLEEVVEHYTSGIKDHPELDWILRGGIELSENEKSDLIDFLKTLTDHKFVSDARFSNPF